MSLHEKHNLHTESGFVFYLFGSQVLIVWRACLLSALRLSRLGNGGHVPAQTLEVHLCSGLVFLMFLELTELLLDSLLSSFWSSSSPFFLKHRSLELLVITVF
jgi:hypothetical protein